MGDISNDLGVIKTSEGSLKYSDLFLDAVEVIRAGTLSIVLIIIFCKVVFGTDGR